MIAISIRARSTSEAAISSGISAASVDRVKSFRPVSKSSQKRSSSVVSRGSVSGGYRGRAMFDRRCSKARCRTAALSGWSAPSQHRNSASSRMRRYISCGLMRRAAESLSSAVSMLTQREGRSANCPQAPQNHGRNRRRCILWALLRLGSGRPRCTDKHARLDRDTRHRDSRLSRVGLRLAYCRR